MKNWIFVLGLSLVVGLSGLAHAGTGGLITTEELVKELDNPEVVVLDVRTGRDWKSSEFKIKGAMRANPGDFKTWVAKLDKNKRYITYCA